MPNTLARDIAAAVARLEAATGLRAWRAPDADRADPFVSALTGAHRAATSPWSRHRTPTAAELQANDYPTGPVDWQGWRLHMETPAQGIREGVDPGGREWRNVVKAHYGYFAGTVGADGEGVDVFLGPSPESRVVWVLNQTNADGSFDEHKVLAGFIDARAAVDAYRLSYTPGWNRYGAPLRLTLDQLRWWLQWGDKSRPLSLDLVPPGEPDTMTDTTTPSTLSRVFWDSAAMPAAGRTLADVLYAIRLDDAADGLLVDPMTMADVLEGAERVVMDSLVIQVGRLKPKMDALLRVMEAVGAEVKPVALQLSEPVRRFGGAHVAALFELSDGQTVTVWFHNPDSTPAKLSPADTLVSWKWVLNKKDVTIVVAPESGQDLNMREVARRIMRLAAKNSAAFARANAKRAATMTEIEGLRGTLAERQAALADLHRQIEAAKVAAEDRERVRAEKAAQAAAIAAVPTKPSFAFSSATDDALRLLALGERNPAQRSAFKAAVAIESLAESLGLSVSWFAEEALPTLDSVALDDALFPELGEAGYVGGRISRGKYLLATVHLRDDGAALFAPEKGDPIVFEAMGYAKMDDYGDDFGVWHDDAAPVIGVLAQNSEDIETYEPDPAREAAEAAEAVAREKREAAVAAARDAALKDAQAAGAGMPGFCGAVFSTAGGVSLKDALARQPVGSFVLVVDRDWKSPQDEPVFGIAMFSRQKLGKRGGIDPAGKPGNVQVSRLLTTAAEAYAAGIENVRKAGGVVLGDAAVPAPSPEKAAITDVSPEPAEAAFLREVKAGAHDALALGDLLDRIEASVKALADAGQLAGEGDALASEAIARWVSLDEKANG